MVRYFVLVAAIGLSVVFWSVSSYIKMNDKLVGNHIEGFIPELVNGLPERSKKESTSCIVHISYEQLRAQKEIELDFNEECDSVRIYVPSGGTVTHAGLYKDSLSRKPIVETPSFSIGENGINYMTLSRKVRGRFYLNYGSCHWGSQMWIVIE